MIFLFFGSLDDRVVFNSFISVIYSSALSQPAKFDAVTVKDSNQGSARTAMESVLSLDNGMWSHHVEESFPAMINEVQEDPFKLVSIKQPSPPPVLVQLQQASAPIPPSQVADPRPGPAKSFQDTSDAYHHLHVVGLFCYDYPISYCYS